MRELAWISLHSLVAFTLRVTVKARVINAMLVSSIGSFITGARHENYTNHYDLETFLSLNKTRK